jgi:hypothetical protein
MPKEQDAEVKEIQGQDTEAQDIQARVIQAGESAKAEIGRPAMPTVNWDDPNMRTSYANVVNAASTREEVTLFFGTNQTWNLTSDKQEVNVRLSDRVVLNPYAAKRLWTLLGAVLNEYEKRFGTLSLERVGDTGRSGNQ